MEKPETTPFFEFYLDGLCKWVESIGDGVSHIIFDIRKKVSGLWMCGHCGKYHNRRVKTFWLYYREHQNYVCSLAIKKDAEGEIAKETLKKMNYGIDWSKYGLGDWSDVKTSLENNPALENFRAYMNESFGVERSGAREKNTSYNEEQTKK